MNRLFANGIYVLVALLLSATVAAAQEKTFERELKEKEDEVEFMMKKGKTYTINMNAKFDTYLKLKNPDGKIVARDDDSGGGFKGLQARIVYKAKETGKYTIVATSYMAKSRGEYTITVKEGIPPEVLALRRLFREMEFDKALTQAKKQKKLLMVDFTASWCGPCRMMEQKTFIKDDVQKFLKNKGVCIQVDVDTNKELAKKYGVKAIPNIVFVNAEGEVAGRIIGFRDAERFINDTEKTLNKKKDDK